MCAILHRYPTPKSSHLDLKVLKRPLRDSYNAFAAYGSSKLCCLLLAQELHRQYSGRGVSCNSVHPGNLLSTNLMRNANCAYRVAQMLAKPLTSSVVSLCWAGFFCSFFWGSIQGAKIGQMNFKYSHFAVDVDIFLIIFEFKFNNCIHVV